MGTPGAAPVGNIPVNNVRVPNFLSVYANNVSIGVSMFDVSMVFGQMLGVENGVGQVEQTVRVTMAPTHAKLFLLALMQQVEQYERNFNAIPMPPVNAFPPEMREWISKLQAEHESGQDSIRHSVASPDAGSADTGEDDKA